MRIKITVFSQPMFWGNAINVLSLLGNTQQVKDIYEASKIGAEV